jgi:TM2 domain-containing membrane protein YozV
MTAKTKTVAAKKVDEPKGLAPRNTVVSYVLLVLFGVVGGHQLYHRRTMMAAGQVFLTILVLATFGSHIGLYLMMVAVGWLIADAVMLRKWNEEDGLVSN